MPFSCEAYLLSRIFLTITRDKNDKRGWVKGKIPRVFSNPTESAYLAFGN